MLITVYIPCHNYVSFVDQAIRSVLTQIYPDWELIIVDDGSVDNSLEVIRKYHGHERVTVLRNETAKGLREVANQCISMARGDYVLRLDADDRIHTYCLDILARAAKQSPDTAIFFTDYFYIDESDNVLGVECLPTTGLEYQAKTFPPHGACSLIRKDVFESIGLYDNDVRCQDGHEVWLKVLRSSYKYAHIPLPLFYYRQHGDSLSNDLQKILQDRSRIKRKLASTVETPDRVVAIIPVKNTYPDMPDIPFRKYQGQTLLESAINEAKGVREISEVVVTTDCPRVAAFTRARFADVVVLLRPPELCTPTTSIAEIVSAVARERRYSKDTVICLLSVHTPRRKSCHIQKALDNFRLYDVDSVVSVYEERSLIYQMGEVGLKPLNPSQQYRLRREREAVYVDTGAVRVFRVSNLETRLFLGKKIGHALMAAEDAVQIKSPHDFHILDPDEDVFDVPV